MTAERRPDLSELAEVDRLIHEPSRMAIMAVLFGVEKADFKFLLSMTGLTRGNLSAHTAKLEEAGYLAVKKGYLGKRPHTDYSLTGKGRAAFKAYSAKLKWMAKTLGR